ncbi:MAG: hypothetical protein KC646_04475 [Candidatus Cloacimonetes bacterium]|nr:hypothetical protein [Candidatus Cloacimonadota bacterium]
MKSCRDISMLVSKALDSKLNISDSMTVRLHNLICKVCRTEEKQMILLHRAILTLKDQHDLSDDLSDDAKLRIQKSIEDALSEE